MTRSAVNNYVERDFRLVLTSLALTGVSGLLIALGLTFSSLKLNDYGIVRSFPVTFYLGLALLPVASSPLWFTRSKVHVMVVGQLVLLLIALSLSPYIVESTVRFRSAYKNFGDVDWLLTSGGLDPGDVIYHNWPLFPGLMAGLVKATGLEPTTLMGTFPFLINLAYMVPLVILVRQFGGNDNRWWAGVWFFYLFNWTGQNYFSPQAFAFLLFLVLLAVLAHVAVRREGNFGGPLAAAVLLIYGAIVLTHLLTGILALITLAVLHASRRLKQPSLLVAAVVILLAWQSYGAFSYFQENHERNLSNLLNPEGFILFNVQDRLKGADGHVVVGRLRTLSTLAAFLTASGGLLVWLKELASQQNGRWKLYRTFEARNFEAASGPRSVLASIASNRPVAFAVPVLFGLAVTGPIFVYGGEMLIRIMLFSLPALCVLFLLTVSWRATFLPAVAVLALAAPLHIVTYYGNELYDYISPREIEGFEFVRTQLAPANVIGGYPAGAFRNTPELEWRAAVGAGESELPSPSVYLDPEGYSWRRPEWPTYAAVGRGDGAAAHLFYDQQGFVEASRSTLDATCNFTLVFDSGDIAIYRWRPDCDSNRSPVVQFDRGSGVGFPP